MTQRIVLTGGLSGGHTFPLVAVARELRTLTQGDVEFCFIGSRGPFEAEAMAAEGIPTKFILTAKWRRYASFQNIIDVFKFPLACLQALWYLLWFMPDAVFSKGGAASVPIALAAWVYRIPILLHDSDAVAGRANRLVARFAKRIAIAYEHARQFFPVDKVVLTGNPVRTEILAGKREDGLELFGFDGARPVVLVMGGSLGARALNRLLMQALPKLLETGIQVVHITGTAHIEEVTSLAAEKGIDLETAAYQPVPFLDARQMAAAYALANVVIARAGAGTIAELAAIRKPSILIPLPTAANNEQHLNAYEVASTGGVILMEEANASEHLLTETVANLIQDKERLARMSEALGRFSHPDAARVLAEGILHME